MSHKDPMARKEKRPRVNLNHYHYNALEALAVLHRKQLATYLAEIVLAHLDSFDVVVEHDRRSIKRSA